MKDIQLIAPAGTVCFCPYTQQEVSIPFGVKDNGDLSPADILCDQQLCQPGFTDTGGTINNGVTHPLSQRQRHILFIRFNTMQCRIPAHRRQRAYRIQRRVLAQKLPQTGDGMFRFQLKLTGHPVQPAGLKVPGYLRAQRILKALGVFLCPAKSPPQKKALTAHGYLPGTHHITGQTPQIATVADDLHSLAKTDRCQNTKTGSSGITDRRRERHRPGRCHTDTGRRCRHHGSVQLHRRSQQGLNHITVTHDRVPLCKRRRHHERGKFFSGDADRTSSLRCNTITSRHASAAFSSNALYTGGPSCPPT
ncbi:hypothetical protein BvCmsNSNP036_05119 [Escherichia coli]|nr:hypothetical protein BvCmsNSNP036_05119 [Escherichia coli]